MMFGVMNMILTSLALSFVVTGLALVCCIFERTRMFGFNRKHTNEKESRVKARAYASVNAGM